MPQRKRPLQFFGMHHAFAFHPEIKKFSARHPGVLDGVGELEIILRIAANRYAFAASSTADRRLIAFWRIYQRDPNAILKLMLLLRKILSQWEKTESGKVKNFLLTHRATPIDKRTPIIDDNGNCTAVVAKRLLDDTERTFPTTGLSSNNVNKLMYPEYVHVGSLLDKEIATLLKVKPESVKKARQFIARLNEKLAYWQHPEVIKYQKTGMVTPELKRLLKPQSKGKSF
jgi:hypothetical protein